MNKLSPREKRILALLKSQETFVSCTNILRQLSEPYTKVGVMKMKQVCLKLLRMGLVERSEKNLFSANPNATTYIRTRHDRLRQNEKDDFSHISPWRRK